jgi:hypothetical protein
MPAGKDRRGGGSFENTQLHRRYVWNKRVKSRDGTKPKCSAVENTFEAVHTCLKYTTAHYTHSCASPFVYLTTLLVASNDR